MNDRRLYRSEQDKMIFGVAGGLADYFDVDVSLVRLGWVLMCVLTAGVGILAYLAMGIVTPTYYQVYGVEENGDEAAEDGDDPPEAGDAAGDEAGEAAPGDVATPATASTARPVVTRRRRRHPRSRRRSGGERGGAGMILGIILLVIGGIALMNSLDIFEFLRFGSVWPVLIIAFGGLILFSRRER
jgi:phage shock protein C